jgi:hypothetical protein
MGTFKISHYNIAKENNFGEWGIIGEFINYLTNKFINIFLPLDKSSGRVPSFNPKRRNQSFWEMGNDNFLKCIFFFLIFSCFLFLKAKSILLLAFKSILLLAFKSKKQMVI